eukprot:RCo000212
MATEGVRTPSSTARAAGGGIRPLWETPKLSELSNVPRFLPPPNLKAPPPPPTLRKPPPSVVSLTPSQRLPSREQLLGRSVGHQAPHSEFYLPGYMGHRPRSWDVVSFNHRALAAAKRGLELSLSLPPAPRPAQEKLRPSRRQFEVPKSIGYKNQSPSEDTGSRKNIPVYTQVSGILLPRPKRSPGEAAATATASPHLSPLSPAVWSEAPRPSE